MAEYALAPNFNNVAGFIQLDRVIINNRPIVVRGVGRYNGGELQTNTNGRATFIGFASTSFEFSVLTYAMYEYLNDTFLGGNNSADVTVRTRRDGTAFANYNAVMTLPFTSELTKRFGAYTNVVAQLTRLEAI